jgi:hypothetical protein
MSLDSIGSSSLFFQSNPILTTYISNLNSPNITNDGHLNKQLFACTRPKPPFLCLSHPIFFLCSSVFVEHQYSFSKAIHHHSLTILAYPHHIQEILKPQSAPPHISPNQSHSWNQINNFINLSTLWALLSLSLSFSITSSNQSGDVHQNDHHPHHIHFDSFRYLSLSNAGRDICFKKISQQ